MRVNVFLVRCPLSYWTMAEGGGAGWERGGGARMCSSGTGGRWPRVQRQDKKIAFCLSTGWVTVILHPDLGGVVPDVKGKEKKNRRGQLKRLLIIHQKKKRAVHTRWPVKVSPHCSCIDAVRGSSICHPTTQGWMTKSSWRVRLGSAFHKFISSLIPRWPIRFFFTATWAS